jgi:hypothetical protein
VNIFIVILPIQQEAFMTTATTTRRSARANSNLGGLAPDPVPLAMQQGEEVLVLMPVTVIQHCRDGRILVRGGGVSKFAEPHELLRYSDIVRGKAFR